MAFDVTKALERRRLRHRLTFWRVAAIGLAALAVAVIGFRGASGLGIFGPKHVARVEVSGIITNDRKQLKLLDKLAENDRVAAIVLAVDSPGGTTTGGEALYLKIREIGEKKPVVAVFGTVATSAAYIVGLATDRIVARGNTITGSVGVVLQWAEFGGLLDKLGVKVNEVKSGTLKAEPSLFTPLTEEGRVLTRSMVKESQDWFNGLVRERRELDLATVPGLTEGRIYSGREALTYKLIDQIGGEREALDWLKAEKGLASDLEIKDWSVDKKSGVGLFSRALAGVLAALGAELAGAEVLRSTHARLEIVELGGLVSVWHAGAK